MVKVKIAEFENKFTFQTLKFILYLILFMPLLFLSVFLFPFITTKILYFRFLVEAAALLYLLLAARYPELRPRLNLLTKSVLAYLAVILVASLFGVNFYRSFWGTVERGEGIITILHFAVYFVIITSVMKKRTDWNNYLYVALIASLINAFYGLGQLLGVDFLTNTTGSRIAGTIGNPAFFAAYLMYGVFFGLYLLYEIPKGSAKRWFILAIVIFNLFMAYKTATRGSLIAVFAAMFLFLIFKIFLSLRGRTKLVSALAVILLSAAAFSIYAFRQSSFVRSSHALSRLATISLKDKTTQSRLDTWQASWKGWNDRLITGYGYENFNIAFNKYFPARIFKTNNSQIWFDRAHNIFFEIAVTSGILGLAAYAFILLTAIYYLFKLFRQNRSDPASFKYLVLFLGLVVFFVQNLFVFDTQATYLMFYLFLAVVAGLYQLEKSETEQHKVPGFSLGKIMTSIAIIIFILINYFVNLQPAKANHFAITGIKAAKEEKFKEVKKIFEKALGYGTYMDEEIRQRMVDAALEAVASGQLTSEEQRDFLSFTIAELRESLSASPHDARNHLYLLAMMNKSNGYFPELVDESIELAHQALRISPTRPQTYFELGQSYFFKKEYDRGLAAFAKAIELNPEPKESHLNYLLATIVSERKDLEESEWAAVTARGLAFTLADYQALARAYLIAQNKEGAVKIYLQALMLDPKNADLHAKLASVYGELCDVENAKKEIEKTAELNQSYILQGQAFLRELEIKCKK